MAGFVNLRLCRLSSRVRQGGGGVAVPHPIAGLHTVFFCEVEDNKTQRITHAKIVPFR